MRRDIFQAIADPTRRTIINFIIKEPMTPNSLAEEFDMSRQAVSKHLRILDECGLITLKQIGRERFYQVRPKKLKVVADWLEPFREMWESKFENLDQVLQRMKQES